MRHFEVTPKNTKNYLKKKVTDRIMFGLDVTGRNRAASLTRNAAVGKCTRRIEMSSCEMKTGGRVERSDKDR